MKHINIGGTDYPFKITLYGVSKFLRDKGFSFGRIGEYIAEDEIGGIYSLICLGINNADDKASMTPDKIDEIVGADFNVFGELTEWVFGFFGIATGDPREEAVPEEATGKN